MPGEAEAKFDLSINYTCRANAETLFPYMYTGMTLEAAADYECESSSILEALEGLLQDCKLEVYATVTVKDKLSGETVLVRTGHVKVIDG